MGKRTDWQREKLKARLMAKLTQTDSVKEMLMDWRRVKLRASI